MQNNMNNYKSRCRALMDVSEFTFHLHIISAKSARDANDAFIKGQYIFNH